MIYGSVVASFCCEGFGLMQTTRVNAFGDRPAGEGIGKVDEVLKAEPVSQCALYAFHFMSGQGSQFRSSFIVEESELC